MASTNAVPIPPEKKEAPKIEEPKVVTTEEPKAALPEGIEKDKGSKKKKKTSTELSLQALTTYRDKIEEIIKMFDNADLNKLAWFGLLPNELMSCRDIIDTIEEATPGNANTVNMHPPKLTEEQCKRIAKVRALVEELHEDISLKRKTWSKGCPYLEILLSHMITYLDASDCIFPAAGRMNDSDDEEGDDEIDDDDSDEEDEDFEGDEGDDDEDEDEDEDEESSSSEDSKDGVRKEKKPSPVPKKIAKKESTV